MPPKGLICFGSTEEIPLPAYFLFLQYVVGAASFEIQEPIGRSQETLKKRQHQRDVTADEVNREAKGIDFSKGVKSREPKKGV